MTTVRRIAFMLTYYVKLKLLTRDKFVWYASYGSNIFKDRFYCYVKGGRYPGNSSDHVGCTDNSPPLQEKNIVINHGLYFAKKSKSWDNKGVGFIKLEKNENEKTFGKMYLIKKEQFLEILKQETKTTEDIDIDFDQVKHNGKLEILKNSWYGSLLFLGTDGGFPIFTFTNTNNLKDFNKPAEDYLRTIISGIKESFSLTTDELVVYLQDKPGIIGNYSQRELERLCDLA